MDDTLILQKLPVNAGYTAVIDALNGMCARRLGEGHFSVAYELDFDVLPQASWSVAPTAEEMVRPIAFKRERRCIKVNRRPDTGGWITLNAAKHTYKADPHAPMVYGIVGDKHFWVAEMEVLTKGRRGAWGDHLPDTNYIMGHGESREPCEAFMKASPFMREIDRLCHIMGERKRWDLHSSNMMRRGDQAVIVDPLCGVSHAQRHEDALRKPDVIPPVFMPIDVMRAFGHDWLCPKGSFKLKVVGDHVMRGEGKPFAEPKIVAKPNTCSFLSINAKDRIGMILGRKKRDAERRNKQLNQHDKGRRHEKIA